MNLNQIPKQEMIDILNTGGNRLQDIENIQYELEKVKKSYRPTEGGYKELWHGIHPIGKKLILLLLGMGVAMQMGESLNQVIMVLYNYFGLSVQLIGIIMNVLEIILIILLPVLAQPVANNIIVKWNRKHADTLEQNREYNNRVVRVEEESLRQKLMQVTGKYTEISSLLPLDYKYDKDALWEIAGILRNDRAECVGDAINRYREDLHRRHMEAKMDEANRLSREQLMATIAQTEALRQNTEARNNQAAAWNNRH